MFRRRTPETSHDENVATVARAIADLHEILSVVREAAIGYRAQLEADGISPTMAEQMAAEYHSFILTTIADR